MTRKRKDYRELKVSSFSGYGYKSAPMLRIQGLWLEELGFNIGDPILVKCEDGKLIITVDHAREDAETKEQAFLDEEMKKLQKKFEVEKKKIYQQVVAERKVRYGVFVLFDGLINVINNTAFYKLHEYLADFFIRKFFGRWLIELSTYKVVY